MTAVALTRAFTRSHSGAVLRVKVCGVHAANQSSTLFHLASLQCCAHGGVLEMRASMLLGGNVDRSNRCHCAAQSVLSQGPRDRAVFSLARLPVCMRVSVRWQNSVACCSGGFAECELRWPAMNQAHSKVQCPDADQDDTITDPDAPPADSDGFTTVPD
jgi:hypothetical protein